MKRSAFLFGVLALATCVAARAQYPERTATMISGFPAGGMVDIVARALAEGMKPKYPAGLVVLNKPGMGGAIAIGPTCWKNTGCTPTYSEPQGC